VTVQPVLPNAPNKGKPMANLAPPITLELAQRALRYKADTLPERACTIATQCLTDWCAVTLAALDNPAHTRLLQATRSLGGNGAASVIGHQEKYPAPYAALINGTTSHALDFDDVNLAISGHPSAVLFSALLALAESRRQSGQALLSAFVAGYETACRIGILVNPNHMARGYHATGTICSFGAAVACAHLLGFTPEKTAQAMGLAGTLASGVKAMFGNLGKPLHAGLAARNGLEAALWVESGYSTRQDVLECACGFAVTHSSDFNCVKALEEVPGMLHLYDNLFKYDASCYGTHAAMECVRQIKRAHKAVTPDAIHSVRVLVDSSLDSICNIQHPQSGQQGQFSLRLCTAFALLDVDTTDSQSFDTERINRPDVLKLMEKITIELQEGWPSMQAKIVVVCRDSSICEYMHNAGIAEQNMAVQSARIARKFETLAASVLGPDRASQLLDTLLNFSRSENLDAIGSLCSHAASESKCTL